MILHTFDYSFSRPPPTAVPDVFSRYSAIGPDRGKQTSGSRSETVTSTEVHIVKQKTVSDARAEDLISGSRVHHHLISCLCPLHPDSGAGCWHTRALENEVPGFGKRIDGHTGLVARRTGIRGMEIMQEKERIAEEQAVRCRDIIKRQIRGTRGLGTGLRPEHEALTRCTQMSCRSAAHVLRIASVMRKQAAAKRKMRFRSPTVITFHVLSSLVPLSTRLDPSLAP